MGFGLLAIFISIVGWFMFKDTRRRRLRARPVNVPPAIAALSAASLTRLGRIVRLARVALDASAVLYFDIDQKTRQVVLRDCDLENPSVAPSAGTALPMAADPFGFVAERRQSFYITDFKPLLWSLPYYPRETRVGTLLAAPVMRGGAVHGVLVAEKTETQAFTGREPALLEGFAAVVADAL